ncbi:MAG: glycoside hydrolase family 20 zincin-like fold domain-containing protein, partial [Dysgonomonas sp.]
MSIRKIVSVLFVFSSLFCWASQDEVVVPNPQKMEVPGEWTPVISVYKVKADKKLTETAGYLQPIVNSWNALIRKTDKGKKQAKIPISLELVKIKNDHAEAYELAVKKSSITIKANTQQGCFYGIQTL